MCINLMYKIVFKKSYTLSTKFLAGFNICKFSSCKSAIKFCP